MNKYENKSKLQLNGQGSEFSSNLYLGKDHDILNTKPVNFNNKQSREMISQYKNEQRSYILEE